MVPCEGGQAASSAYSTLHISCDIGSIYILLQTWKCGFLHVQNHKGDRSRCTEHSLCFADKCVKMRRNKEVISENLKLREVTGVVSVFSFFLHNSDQTEQNTKK